MGAASTAAEIGDVRGRGGVLVMSTPETVMGELVELLELRHIKHRRRCVLGEPCMRGYRAICRINNRGQDVPCPPVPIGLLSCLCCSASCPLPSPLWVFTVSVIFSEPFSGIPLFCGS